MPRFEPCALWIISKWATAAMHAKSLGLVPGITLIPHSMVHPLLVIHDSYMAWRKYCSWLVRERLSLDFWVCFSLARYPGLCPTSSLNLSPFILLCLSFPLFHLNFLWCSCPPSISFCQLLLCISISYFSLSLFLLLSFFLHLSFFCCSVRLFYVSLVLYMHTKSH